MKPSTVLTIIAGVTTAQAKCFGSGELWGDQTNALKIAKSACQSGGFAKNYGPSGTPSGYKGICRNGNGKKLEFQIWHVKEGERELGADECYSGLSKEITGCDHGGDTTYTNWRYKADPNAGVC